MSDGWTGPFGATVVGVVGLVLAGVATFGLARTVLGDAPSVVAGLIVGGGFGYWVAAYFSGGGRSVRRAGLGMAVATPGAAICLAIAVALGAEAGSRVVWIAVIVWWLVGASLVVRHRSTLEVTMRIVLSLGLGAAAGAGALSLAGSGGLVALIGIPLIAAVFPVADLAARRLGPAGEST